MSVALDESVLSAVQLPALQLSEIPEVAKDFLIASALDGKQVRQVMVDILVNAAAQQGFPVKKAAQ